MRGMNPSDLLAAAAAHGFTAAVALIVAIGAQNAFVLRQGLRGEHVGTVVALCALSDALLIQVGVWGLGALTSAVPALAQAARWLGAAFLLWYASLALRRALRPQALTATASGTGAPWGQVVGTTLALTWLNPHVYLDTVVLLGTLASPYAAPGKLAFALGASMASLCWFVLLGQGARRLAPWFAQPRAWQWLDGGIALTMALLAVSLMAGVL
ncbi:LysE/ArgO family amino acid transporter [Acidovorax lacteus]|uniref:LysE/ArgO family amino acid transporter n=1 Tax=Acidovorax lacteus TaxID=1924988 RepID=A0ABP8L8H1_9BURK